MRLQPRQNCGNDETELNPILVDLFRNKTLESRHRGAVAAVDASGRLVFSLGNIDALVFPRSALKPIQAIPLLESGAAEHFRLSRREIALGCASHNAEQAHLDVLTAWMSKLHLDESMLECGASLPLHTDSAHQWLREGGQAMRQLHNCSGKHTGMMTLAKFMDVSVDGYSAYDHPVQQRWMNVLSDLAEVDSLVLPWDRDGCGLPALALPLRNFALGLSRFCALDQQPVARRKAMHDILIAMHENPDMVAGTDRCCTATMSAHHDLVVKTGAEGVFAAIAPSAGIAVALKIDDGATRAADAALGAVLKKLGVLSTAQYESLSPWYAPELRNSQNIVVGRLAPAAVWDM